MKIARILAPVHSLGPGERICLWTQGCKKRCKGCVSPEMQPFTGTEVAEDDLSKVLIQLADASNCKGLTISGGDPFEQAEGLLSLLKQVRTSFSDILVYTGYELEELRNGFAGEEGKASLNYIDVLIDGRYLEQLNTPDCVLRGSTNQKIHYFKDSLCKEYTSYLEKGRVLECFVHGQNTIITGIINKEDNHEREYGS